MNLNSKIKQIIEETRELLNKYYNDNDYDVYIKPEKSLIKLDNFNEEDYDPKTLEIINLLLDRYEQNYEINDIDICILNKLLNKEIDYSQIESEITKCKNDFVYFANNYLQIKNKSEEGGYFVNSNLVYGDKVKYKLYGIHRYLSESIDTYQYICGVKSRQIGFTTNVGAKCLHKIIFENNKTILVISKAFEEAKKTLEEQRFMYINLPFFLRRSIYKDNMSQLSLGNRYNYSSIEVKTSGKRSGRSVAATWLIIDEAEFIVDVDSLQAAAAPTLSSTKGKCIVLSTPYKQKSQFYNLVDNIIDKKNKDQKLVIGHQSFIPGRDQNQYEKQIALLNNDPEKIKTELEIQQISTSDFFIDVNYLTNIKNGIDIKNLLDFVRERYNWIYKDFNMFLSNYDYIEFYDYPIIKPENNDVYVEYLLSLDPYEGANDNHGIAIFRLDTSMDSSGLISFNQIINALGKTKKENLMDFIIDANKIFPNLKILIERNKGYKYLSELVNYNEFDIVNEISLNKNMEYTFNEKHGIFLTEFVRKKILNLVYNYVINNYNKNGIERMLVDECRGLKYKSRRVEGEFGDDVVFSVGMGLIYIDLIYDLMNKKNMGIKIDKNNEFIFLKKKFKCLLFGGPEFNNTIELLNDFYKENTKKYNGIDYIFTRNRGIITKKDIFNILQERYNTKDKSSLIDFFNFMNN